MLADADFVERDIDIFIEVEGDLDGEDALEEDALEEELDTGMEVLVVGISMECAKIYRILTSR